MSDQPPALDAPAASAFPYVAEVVFSNVKSDPEEGEEQRPPIRNLALGPRTLIVGPNASGKSAIVNAVELALTGTAGDVVGRDVVADPSMLGTLAPAGEALVAQVKLSTGLLCNTTVPYSGDGAYKRPIQSSPQPNALPLRAVQEALAGGLTKVRAFLLALVENRISERDLTAALEAMGQGDAFAATRARLASHGTPIAILQAVTAFATAEERSLRKDAEALERATQDSMRGLAPSPLDSDFTDAQAKIEAIEAQLRAARAMASNQVVPTQAAFEAMQARNHIAAYQQSCENVAKLRDQALVKVQAAKDAKALELRFAAQVEAARADVLNARDALQRFDATRPADTDRGRRERVQSVVLLAEGLRAAMDKHGAEATGCPLCAGTLSAQRAEALIAAGMGALADLEGQSTALGHWEVQRQRWQKDVERSMNYMLRSEEEHRSAQLQRAYAVQNAVEACERLSTAEQAMPAEPSEEMFALVHEADVEEEPGYHDGNGSGYVEVTSAESAEDALQKAREHLQNLQNLQARHASARINYGTVGEKRARAQAYKDLLTACKAVQGTLLASAIAHFESAVQAHLPVGLQFGVVLQDADEREVCRMGFWRGKGAKRKLHTALSGYEWAIEQAALTLAVRSVGDVAVCIPEERSFDAQALRAAMDAFSHSEMQLIMTTTTVPAGVVINADGWIDTGTAPAGWTILQTGALPWEARAGGGVPVPPKTRKPRKKKEDAPPPPSDDTLPPDYE